MTSEIREFPADCGASVALDEWTSFLQNYTNTITNLIPSTLETRRSEFLSFAMTNHQPTDSINAPVLMELQKLIDDMRHNENSALRHWSIILNKTFQTLQQIAYVQNKQKNSQLNEFNDIPQTHFRDDSQYLTQIELWEPRLRLLLRLAPSVRLESGGGAGAGGSFDDAIINHDSRLPLRPCNDDPRFIAAREAALSQCCPLRMKSTEGFGSRSCISSIADEKFGAERSIGASGFSKKGLSASIGSSSSANQFLNNDKPTISANLPFDELLYSLPNVRIGLYPNSVPPNHNLRRLIILSAILNDASRQSSTQLLDWARKVLEALQEEAGTSKAQQNSPAAAAAADSSSSDLVPLARHQLPSSLLIYLCVRGGFLKDGRTIAFLHEQITRRWLKSILNCSSAHGFQVLQRLPIQSAQTKFLLARAYIEAQQFQSYIGDPILRQSYDQWLHNLRLTDERAIPTIYLEIWCSLYDRTIGLEGSTSAGSRSYNEGSEGANQGANMTYINTGQHSLIRLMSSIQELSDELMQRSNNPPSNQQMAVAGVSFTRHLVDCLDHQPSDSSGQHLIEQTELEKILAYIARSSSAPSRGAFTRAVLATYHQSHQPIWFKLPAFIIWTSWVTSFLDIPFIPHYVATHQKDFPDTQYALTALKEYRTGVCSAPQKNAAIAQLTRVIGAALGDSEMITVLANELGFTPMQVISPHGMLLSFVQNCVSLSHI